MMLIGPYALNRVHQGDALDCLKRLPDGSIHCCVTSPPYWGLRDYGTAKWEGGDPACDHLGKPMATRANVNRNTGTGEDVKNVTIREFYREICGKCGARRIDAQIGLEASPEEYVSRLVDVFREVRRVLREDGSLWLNLGDSYSGYHGNSKCPDDDAPSNKPGYIENMRKTTVGVSGLKSKDLAGIPWRVAFALQADGWYLRQDIVWAKPNPMPESVLDRCTKAHEYIFLLTKSPRYYFDNEAIREPNSDKWTKSWGDFRRNKVVAGQVNNEKSKDEFDERYRSGGRNKRDVWTIPPDPIEEEHYAAFPMEIPRVCISAGTSERGCCPKCGKGWERMIERRGGPPPGDHRKREPLLDCKTAHETGTVAGSALSEIYRKYGYPENVTIGFRPSCNCPGLDGDHPGSDCADEDNWPRVPCVVLDPFAGTGTVLAVAIELGRNAIGFDLSEKYCKDIAGVRLEAVRKGFTPSEIRAGQKSLFEEE